MNTNTPLHDVLEEHAHDVHGIPTGDRLGQVHGRIRGVRRRRRAGVAAVAAAAIAVVGVVTLLPRDPEAAPTDRDLAGHTAPKTIDSLGFSYEFADAAEGDKRAHMKLPGSDQPRVITWAGEDGPLRVWSTQPLDGDGAGPVILTSTATAFSDFQYIAPGEPVDLRVTSDTGQVALAVYDLEATPEAVAHDGVFFRNDVSGSRLIASSFGDPGQGQVKVQFTVPEAGLRPSEFCYGVPDDYLVWLQIGRGDVSVIPCERSAPFDPGTSGARRGTYWGTEGGMIQPGEQVTARIWVAEPPLSEQPGPPPPVDVPGVRLGLALYADAAPAATVGDWDLAPRVEHDGHLYEYLGSSSSDPGSAGEPITVRADDVPILVLAYSSDGLASGLLDVYVDGQFERVIGGRDVRTLGVIQHHTSIYRITGGSAMGPKTILGFATYERVD